MTVGLTVAGRGGRSMMEPSLDDVMPGGRFARPVRHGDTVERDIGPGGRNVHALLEHFARVGFDLAPRLLGVADGGRREILSFIAGEAGYPPLSDALRSDEALVSVASAIRSMHQAAAGFAPVDAHGWHALEVCGPLTIDCLGHRDLGPWNMVFDGAEVVGIIDWDCAGPTSRAWDLSYAAHQFVPFHATAALPAFGWSREPDRAARLRLFTASYGGGVSPEEIVDLAIVRMTAIAAHIEAQVRARNPAFDTHRQEGHAQGYRRAAEFIITQRDVLLS